MLTKEENEVLTRVGPGTPCGELLRRYWYPVAVAAELTQEQPKRRIRLLGEDLVLFSEADGAYGLVAEHCSHRGASLYYGFLEDGGLRCPYHGWLYDKAGHCLEQPFEPAESMLKHTLRHPAYPVEKLAGLLFAYLGPPPTPLLPRWDVLVREDGERTIEVQPVLQCNWLQCQENSLDATHTYYTHAYRNVTLGLRDRSTLRPPEAYSFQLFEGGIVKRNSFGNDGRPPFTELGHPAIFPNILWHWAESPDRVSDGSHPIDLQIRVPLDDTHTQVTAVRFAPTHDGSPGIGPEDPPASYITIKDEENEFHMRGNPSQDAMAWETQGPISDRTREHLGTADTGIGMWRQLLKEQIEVVQRGGDPMGVIRDPAKNDIIEIGPSRIKVGDRYVPKPWAGWGASPIWESPPVWLGHLHKAIESAPR